MALRKAGNYYQNLQGPITIGAPTGGPETPGSINAVSLFINGVAVVAGSGAGGVSSITGTANQITASAATGAVTLSLPTAIILPTAGSSVTLADTTHVGTVNAGNALLQGDGIFGYCRTVNANTMFFGANNTNYWQINSAGALSNSTVPTAGTALTVTGISGQFAATINGAASATGFGLAVVGGFTGAGVTALVSFNDANNTSGVNLQLTGNGSNPSKTIRVLGGAFQIVNSAYTATLLSIADAGNTTINAPTSGVALTANGFTNSFAAQINGSSTSGQSQGLFVVAGTNSADIAFKVSNQINTIAYFQVSGNGSGFLGYNGSVSTITFSAAGNVAIPAPASGIGLVVAGVASNTAASFSGAAGTGVSQGVFINAGTNASDFALAIANAANTITLAKVFGNGSFVIGNSGSAQIITGAAAGNVTIAAPTSGVALTVNGVSGTHSTQIADSAGNLFNAGFLQIPQNSQSANYTTVLSDAGKHIYHPSADTTARTYTIAANASVPYPIGTAITFDVDTSAGTITLAINTDTLVWLPSGTTGSRAIAANGQATALKVTATRWHLTGVGIT